ncbi:polysaccharide deacetylase family protein [Catenulispora yoronensis]
MDVPFPRPQKDPRHRRRRQRGRHGRGRGRGGRGRRVGRIGREAQSRGGLPAFVGAVCAVCGVDGVGGIAGVAGVDGIAVQRGHGRLGRLAGLLRPRRGHYEPWGGVVRRLVGVVGVGRLAGFRIERRQHRYRDPAQQRLLQLLPSSAGQTATIPTKPGYQPPATPRMNADVDCSTAKCIALTFDDGPGPDTGRLLDILQSENVPATFFVLGDQAEKYPATVRREYAEGHEVGNHTWDHKDLSTLSAPRSRKRSSAAPTR